MNVQKQIDAYIASQPEPKRSDMQELHRIALEVMPACRLWFLDGKNSENKTVSNPNIGYGLHTIKYASNIRPEERRAAGETFRTWHGMAQVLNFLMTGSVAVYLWRVANPPDPTRFLSATKFRS